MGGLLVRAGGIGLIGDDSESSETLSSDAKSEAELGTLKSRCST